MLQPLLVAESPGRHGAPNGPLAGPPGDRLARFAGFDGWRELHRRFDVRNLIGWWPGPSGKGSAWPTDEAQVAAERAPLGGVCVLLGRRVAKAYGYATPHWGVWLYAPGRLVVVIPHPSGVNLLYNDEAMRDLAGITLRTAIRLAQRSAELELEEAV